MVKVVKLKTIINFAFLLFTFALTIGGGVWESNPPRPALTVPLTVLKTAPFTRTDAPPLPECETYPPPVARVKLRFNDSETVLSVPLAILTIRTLPVSSSNRKPLSRSRRHPSLIRVTLDRVTRTG